MKRSLDEQLFCIRQYKFLLFVERKWNMQPCKSYSQATIFILSWVIIYTHTDTHTATSCDRPFAQANSHTWQLKFAGRIRHKRYIPQIVGHLQILWIPYNWRTRCLHQGFCTRLKSAKRTCMHVRMMFFILKPRDLLERACSRSHKHQSQARRYRVYMMLQKRNVGEPQVVHTRGCHMSPTLESVLLRLRLCHSISAL